MTTQELDAQHVLATYPRELVLVRGEGCRVWDVAGTEYLDFGSGISVCNLGHCPRRVTDAIAEQAGRLVHTSNIYYNELQPQLAARIAEHSFGGRVFFSNSGAEANEGMIKFARKWGHSRGRSEIVYMSHSFHGRTLATLAATDKPAIRAGFGPDMPGFRLTPFNDLAALETTISDTTAAVILEPVQAEGGVHVATQQFLQGVRQLCDERGVLLLLDEVQSGMGRTGIWFAHQHYDIVPDAMSVAKALGNGFPIGAFEVHAKWADVMGAGSHGSTFGGNPLACAAGLAVFNSLTDDKVLDNCVTMAAHFRNGLLRIAEHCKQIREVRGLGLLLGVECEQPVKPIVQRAMGAGLLVLTAGENVLRLLPPLTVTIDELDEALAILESAFSATQ